MIYAYSAGKTKLTSVVWNLKNVDLCYIIYPNSIERFLEILQTDKPEYILGMGVYSGRDQDKIRIETKCTNKFRNDFLDSERKVELEIPIFLKEDKNFKLAQGIGNSYCNFSAYKITKFIKRNSLTTKLTFLHVPRVWKQEQIKKVIDEKN